MIEEASVKGSQRTLRLRLGDHLIQAVGHGEMAIVQSALALLRTVFEDHYVDPEHQSCLFFHGCTVAGTYDFTVVHRGDRVMLSDFTFPWKGPSYVSLPLTSYALEVVRFAERVLVADLKNHRPLPDWQQRYVDSQMAQLKELSALGRRFLSAPLSEYPAFCEQYQELHGKLKRPLEIQVLQVLEQSGPFQPISVMCRVLFGPIRAAEILPMRLNRGDVVRVTVSQFTPEGVVLTLEGVGSGGVRPGDRLYGLQLFYP